MSFGAGHIMDMINRIKQNRDIRPSNRQKFKGNNRPAIYSKSEITHDRPIFKTVPEKELHKIKEEIRERAERLRKKQLITYGVFFAFGLLVIIIGLLFWLR